MQDYSSLGHCFQMFLTRKNKGQAYIVTFALRLYNSYNHTHVPGQLKWLRAQLQVLQNSGSGMFMLRVKTLLERERELLTKSKKEKL